MGLVLLVHWNAKEAEERAGVTAGEPCSTLPAVVP